MTNFTALLWSVHSWEAEHLLPLYDIIDKPRYQTIKLESTVPPTWAGEGEAWRVPWALVNGLRDEFDEVELAAKQSDFQSRHYIVTNKIYSSYRSMASVHKQITSHVQRRKQLCLTLSWKHQYYH